MINQRKNAVLGVVMAALVAWAPACAGTSKGKGPTASGGAGGSHAVAGASGSPGWVVRGSAAVSDGDNKAFYGVGVASGSKNPALLRSTADNRARAELGKVFEVFSASLMKDYMQASDAGNVQAVEQAVKTYSATALRGVEIVDHYIAGDGTLYGLARLTLESARAAQEAMAAGIATSHTTPVNVDDIFDKHAQKPAPKAPPPVVAATTDGTQETPPPSVSATAKQPKEKPAWVDGPDPRYPTSAWLCGVGYGSERGKSQNAAYAALSRIFVVSVANVSKDFMGAYSKTGGASLEVQSSESLTKVSTAKVFSGVTIPEVWQGSDWYALACMDRAQVASALNEQLAETDARIGRHLGRAKSADKAARVKELAKALDALVERAALNGELRIVNADGLGLPAKYSHVDVSSAFEAAVEQLRVAIVVEGGGAYDADFRTLLSELLTSKGYTISGDASADADVLVKASIRMEDAGSGTVGRTAVEYARVVVLAEVRNVSKQTILGSFKEERKEGKGSKAEAERAAVRSLAKKLGRKIGGKIENAMLR